MKGGSPLRGPRFSEIAAALPATVPFVGPKTQERARGTPFRARLGANENLFGPSPKAIAAMERAASEVWQYGDPENHELIAALAAHHRVGTDHIIVGEGIDALLGYLVRLLISPGDPVVTSDGAYPTFNFHVAGVGGALHKVPYRKDHEDPEALLTKAAGVGAKLIYLANPDNPMGSWHSDDVIEAMIDRLPNDALLILDEAYAEFAPRGALPQVDPDHPNVIRMRTFSKAYGMAGARVGYGIGAPGLIRAFDKLRNHFGVNRIAQAGALAALDDPAHVARVVNQVANARDQISAIAHDAGLTPLPSAANFVALDCGRDGDFARSVLAEMAARGVFLRMPFVAPQDRCIRVTAGRPEEMAVFASSLPDALAAARRRLPKA